MTALEEELPLASEFPAASREQWQRLVAGVLARSGQAGLADAEAEQALATEVEDGLRVQPLYTAEDLCTAEDTAPDPGWPGFAPFTRGGRPQGPVLSGWDVRQQHAHPDPHRTNEPVLADLENGVTSLWLTSAAPGCRWPRSATCSTASISTWPPVVLDAGAEFAAAAELLFAWCTDGPAKIAAGEVRGNLGADPLGHDGPHRAGCRHLAAAGGGYAARRPLCPRVSRPAGADRGRAAVPRGRRLGGAGAGRFAGHRRWPICGR